MDDDAAIKSTVFELRFDKIQTLGKVSLLNDLITSVDSSSAFYAFGMQSVQYLDIGRERPYVKILTLETGSTVKSVFETSGGVFIAKSKLSNRRRL